MKNNDENIRYAIDRTWKAIKILDSDITKELEMIKSDFNSTKENLADYVKEVIKTKKLLRLIWKCFKIKLKLNIF